MLELDAVASEIGGILVEDFVADDLDIQTSFAASSDDMAVSFVEAERIVDATKQVFVQVR